MKQILAALFVCVLAGSTVGAQTKTDRENRGLIGPVKTVSTRRTETPLRDGKPGEPKVAQLDLITFDEQGHMIQEDVIDPDGTPREKWVYTYDANGNRTERSGYESSGGLIAKDTYRNEFDTQGRLITTSMYDADGKLNYRMVRNYDYRGLMTDSTTYDRNGSVSNRSTFTYDEKGKLAEFALYNSAGALMQRQTVTNGRNEMLLSNYDGTLKSREIRSVPIKDELDAHGNWTRLTTNKEVTQSGRTEAALEITRRIITYY
jgi:YD repeat-containing protein